MVDMHAMQLTAAMFQDADTAMLPVGSKLFMIFVGVVSVSVLIQTIALVAMAMGASKTQKKFLNIAEEMRSKAVPTLEIARSIMEDTAPRLRVITGNVTEASFLLRAQAERLDKAVASTMETVQEQVDRADMMVSATLDGVEEITSGIQHAVMIPVRQISGIMNGFRAAVDKLTNGKFSEALYRRDEDDFV